MLFHFFSGCFFALDEDLVASLVHFLDIVIHVLDQENMVVEGFFVLRITRKLSQ